MTVDLSLYLVTDSGLCREAGLDLVDVVLAAVYGGVTAVQVREKTASASEFLATVMRLSDAVPERVPLIVNDRVDVFLAARLAGATVAGVHVGQSDLPVRAVRELIGPDSLLGLSAGTTAQLRAAGENPALIDYVGIGALHETRTKPDAPPGLGLTRWAALAGGTGLPAVAIGGVTARDLPDLRRFGAAGAAVVTAICGQVDPQGAAQALRAAWDGH